jgi:hypothetical protein
MPDLTQLIAAVEALDNAAVRGKTHCASCKAAATLAVEHARDRVIYEAGKIVDESGRKVA